MFTFEAKTLIAAPPSVVWQVLMALDRYHEWNSFLAVERPDSPRLNEKLYLRMIMPGAPSYSFQPIVTILEPERHFAWVQHTGMRGIFDGEHHFELKPVGDSQTDLHNYEYYSGLISPLMRRLPMMKAGAQGFVDANEEIRQQAKKLHR